MEMCEYLYPIVQHFHLCGKKKQTDKQRNKHKFENRLSREAGGGAIFFVHGADVYWRCQKIYPNTA